MAEFTYKASDRTGKVVEGNLDSEDESAVIIKLRGMGYIPIKIAPTSGSQALSRSLNFDLKTASPFSKVSSKDLLSFTQELSTLIKAGLPLDRSLTIIIEVTDNEHLKETSQELLKDVRGGKSFSEALSRHPRIFSRLYVNMIKAGEAGGVMDVVLERLVDFLERSQELKSIIANAIIYPALLVVVMGGAVAFLLTFVVPRFVGVFESTGQELPVPTQILLTFSNGIKSYWWLIAAVCFASYAWFRRYTKSEQGRFKWDGFKLKIGPVRDLILKIEVARISRTLGTLINSGVPILQSLGIVREIIGNVIVANSISNIQKAVKEGKGISSPMKNTGIFPSLATHMIRVGEETGSIEEMLLKVADTYDKEVQNSVKRFISVLEPILICGMAVIVICIIVPILLAIVSINDIAF